MTSEPPKIPPVNPLEEGLSSFLPPEYAGLLKSRTMANLARSWMALMTGSREPLIGALEITNECNLRCRHCYWWADRSPEPELRVEEWRAVLRREFQSRGIQGISVCGGEPLLRQDVIRMILDEGYHLWVFTNGILPLPDLPLTYCVSIDGIEANHDKIRGRGNYGKTRKNILSAPHDGVFLNMTINSLNRNDPAELVEEWKGKVRKISFGFHTPLAPEDPLWIPFGPERDGVVDGLLRLKKEHPDFLFNTEGQLRSMKTERWSRECPTWFLLSLDSAGRKKRCALGDKAVCRECGSDLYAGIRSGLNGDILEWMKNMFDLYLKPKSKENPRKENAGGGNRIRRSFL